MGNLPISEGSFVTNFAFATTFLIGKYRKKKWRINPNYK